MKKLKIMLLLFLFAMNIYAQDSINNSYYSLDRITSVTNATEAQVYKLNDILLERNSAINLSETKEQNFDINKAYRKKLNQILDKNQQSKMYRSNIDTNTADRVSKKEYDALVNKHKLPVNIESALTKVLYDYEYEQLYIEQKHAFDKDRYLLERSNLNASKSKWVDYIKANFSKSRFKWKSNFSKCKNVKIIDEDTFISYHFLVNLIKESDELSVDKHITEQDIIAELQSLITKDSFKEMGDKLIDFRVKSTMDYDNRLKKLDSIPYSHAKQVLKDYLRTKFLEKTTTHQPFLLGLNWELRTQAYNIGKEKEKTLSKEKEFTALKAKAIEAGLDENRTQQLISLVKNKNLAIEENKTKKIASTFSDLFQDSTYDTRKAIIAQFGRDVSGMLSKKEFAIIFADRFRATAKKDTKEQLASIFKTHKLNKEQQQKVHELVYGYFLNKAIANVYYKHQGLLKKQKLSVLRYRFEKNYLELMTSFDIKIDHPTKADDRTYKW
ncbi:hypothetical protein Q4Q34_15185 [Flavivirga abyssicola]|uniref:hypothetical protein n=1 Tax=Flavivirga abyssicola TaxID=3063533 RepID=UPI0026E05B31|nr:hypothetical protein [Flavivirga sp. MEBiC07777]WVK12559.1 hypothetical protein Q4Q34_15185 [Flavivirga sp. MEBiC07777]